MRLFSSTPVSWLLGQAVIWGLAAIGGIIVIRGLWLEYKGGKNGYFHAQKRMTEHGEIWVIVGVAVEIIVGVGFAVRDGLQARQTAIEIARQDPMNRPISQISAILRFKINKVNIRAVLHFGGPSVAIISLLEPVDATMGDGKPGVLSPLTLSPTGKLYALYLSSSLPDLVADTFDTPDGFTGTRPYFMQLHMWDFSVGLSTNWEQLQAKELDRVQALRIMVKFLPHDIEILEGSVDIFVNANLRKTFKISPQKDNEEFPLDAFIILATNSSPLNADP
jgi:hypothetical protein